MENRKILDYIILESYHIVHLRADVLEKIKEGYVPLGGASKADRYGNYTQAMVKYEK